MSRRRRVVRRDFEVFHEVEGSEQVDRDQGALAGVGPVTPLAVLTGIIMGSAVTISIGLAMVLAVFLMMGGEYPALTREFTPLLTSFGPHQLVQFHVETDEMRPMAMRA